MKKARWLAMGIVVLAACGPPPPPAGTAEAVAVTPFEAPPVFALIGARERLELTSEQISALDSIGMWNASANQEAMRELRGRDARAATAMPLDSLVRVVRNNNLQAARGVENLLTEEQQQQVCRMFPQDRGRRALVGGAQPPRTAPRRRGEAPGLAERRSVWPWCDPQTEEATPAEEAPPTEEATPRAEPPSEI